MASTTDDQSDAPWQPMPAAAAAPATSARLRPSPAALRSSPQPSRSPPAAAAANEIMSARLQIAQLKAALLATQEAHAATSAHLAAQRYAQQQQAVYATPAAWHRRREVLMNEPTPQNERSMIQHLPTPPMQPLQDDDETTEGIGAATTAASSSNLPLIAGAGTSEQGRRSAPSSLGRRNSLPLQSAQRPGRSPLRPSMHRSVSSLPLTPAQAAASSGNSPALGPSSASSTAGEVAASLHQMKRMLSQFETAKARDHAKSRQLKKMKLEIEAAKAHAHQQSRIQRTFLHISQGLIVVLVALLVYYNYLILAPHVHALFWAGLFWMVLDAPQRVLLRLFAELDARFLDRHAHTLELVLALFTLVMGVLSAGRLSALLVLGISFLVVTFFMFGNRHTVTAVILLLLILLLIAFPLFFLAKTCVMESAEIAARLRQFIEGNPEFQHILEDFSTSATFLWLQRYCRSWGYEVPVADVARLREAILKSIVHFADQLTVVLTGVYGLVTNVGNMMLGLVTFASCLYFLLAASRDFAGTLTWLSPFREEDNAKLLSTMKKSVERIFLCSFSVGALHVIVSYFSFSMCGIDLCLILSFLSGFAAMLPVFSSWIVWIPACGGLLIAGQTVSAAALAGVQLSLLLWVDPMIMRGVPGDSYIIGMSIVFAVYAFGAAGVLLGPLLAAMSFTFLEIYREYLSMPILTHNASAVVQPPPPPSHLAHHHPPPPPPPPPQPTRMRSEPARIDAVQDGQQQTVGIQYLNALDPVGDAFFAAYQQQQPPPLLSLMGSGGTQTEAADDALKAGALADKLPTATPASRRSGLDPSALASPLAANPSRALRFLTPTTAGASPSPMMPTPSRRAQLRSSLGGEAAGAAATTAATPHAIHEEEEEEEEHDDEEEQHEDEDAGGEAAHHIATGVASTELPMTLHRPASVLSPLSSLSPVSLGSPSPLSGFDMDPSPSPPLGFGLDSATLVASSVDSGSGSNGEGGHATTSAKVREQREVQTTHQRLIEQLEAQLQQLRYEEEMQRCMQKEQVQQHQHQDEQPDDEVAAEQPEDDDAVGQPPHATDGAADAAPHDESSRQRRSHTATGTAMD